jgi:hypothetical protein
MLSKYLTEALALETIRNLSKAQKDFFDMAAKCTDGTIENPTVKFYKTCTYELTIADETGIFRNDIYYKLDEYSTKTKTYDSDNFDYLEYELSLMIQKFPDETFIGARKSLQKDVEGKAVKKEFRNAVKKAGIKDAYSICEFLLEFVSDETKKSFNQMENEASSEKALLSWLIDYAEVDELKAAIEAAGEKL